ncbi:DUF4126 domain-containing protein [uncultured Kiloniella sp.]|uniref:DUF4126 domain-containing protein n=1 Tax=uncultured Kiloniella sp. TaxID=1133091 RepID=UPI00261CF859|nr:DUF4126 domain-containing protein [uncultured Kiloniella sp.]
MSLFEIVILAMGVAWAGGINLYATLAVLGILGASGQLDLPDGINVVEHPAVIVIAVVFYVIEFIADKIPAVDSVWDGLHTFIRIPAGALMAAGLLGDVSTEAQAMAFVGGGGLATISHSMKAGTRAILNTSPEPFTNIAASLGEDVLVFVGLATALLSPTVFAAFLALFLILAIWIVPKIFRGIRKVFRFIFGKTETKKDGDDPFDRPSETREKLEDESFSRETKKLGHHTE